MQTGFKKCNNAQIHYQSAGAGESIVFVHGQALDLRMWRTQMEYFSKNYHCIAFDMRGYGKSSRIDGTSYSLPDDLKSLLDQLGVEKFHLVGLSRGGRMAGDFIVTYPEMVKTLTLVDAHISGLPIHESYGAFKVQIRTAIQESDEQAKAVWKHSAIFAPIMKLPEVAPEFLAMLADFEPYFWKNPTLEIPPSPLPSERLQEIECPTLILVGEYDVPHFKRVAKILDEKIKNTKYRMMKGVGHMANMETPELFNHTLNDFLKDNPIT